MKTENKPIAPAEAGLSLVVCSGPRGTVRDENWPCIEWTVQIMHKRVPIWTGEWRAGVGHVDPKKDRTAGRTLSRFTANEESLLMTWQSKPFAEFKNKQLQADVAAKLAVTQKVTPQLDSVMEGLMMDGSAFFDGLRFEEWCAEIGGYDSDSIKAKETYEACDKVGRAISRAVSRDELTGLREWASNR